jgi:hypothetical protein
MFIDFMNYATLAVVGTPNVQVTSIVPGTRVVTYSGADQAASITVGTHVPVVNGNGGLELNGLTKICRDDLTQNNTLHSINASVAGNEWWKANQQNGNNTTFDEDLGQLLLDQIGAKGWETELLLGTRGIRRRYVNTLKAQKRWNDANAGTMHGGFKYIDYNGLPLVFDDDCPKQNLFFLRPSDLLWIQLNGNDFRWMNRDGAILRKVETTDLDAYKATLYKYCDMGVMRREVQGVVYNLADDIP